ncbi:sensor histidine kinase [Haloplanus sp. GCM10025708]|uniref:sensor histidine kinase n=1 Tax=Haloplanus sp. GCM10025708 TaxID=3252679 RepID=UPI0036131055
MVHCNEKATEIYPSVRVGGSLQTTVGIDAVDELDGETIAVETDTGQRFYDVHTSELSDFRNRPVGWLLALQDVTERHEYEQRLEVTNRLLRHNLRNEMNKIVGWTSNIRSASDDDEVQETATRIEAVANDVGALSRDARHIETTLRDRGDGRVSVDVLDVLRSELAGVRSRWPSAEVSLDAPSTATVSSPSAELLQLAFENVLENAIEHNDAETPRVDVTVECDDQVVVRVADNGPGIPEIERKPLSRGGEDSLQHSSGLGLWLVNWAVESAGGFVTFAEGDDGGSVVEMAFPPA